MKIYYMVLILVGLSAVTNINYKSEVREFRRTWACDTEAVQACLMLVTLSQIE